MKKTKKKLLAFIGVIALLGSLLAGCGSEDQSATSESSKSGLEKVTVQSLWIPQGQFAGLYVAQDKGFYEEEGLDVEILPGGTDVTAEDQVANDIAQIGMAFYSSVLTYQDGGQDFINVFQTFKESPQYLVAKKSSGIESGADLKGKKVGSWFGGREYEFYALAKKHGIDYEKDIEWVQQDYTMDQFNNDEIDVASAMSYNEYPLLLQDYDESELSVIDMNKEGVAMLEDCLFVKRSWAEENHDTLVKFLRATIRGWQYAAENRDEAAKIVYEIGESVSEEHQKNMVDKVIDTAVIPEGSDAEHIGELDQDSIQRTIDEGLDTELIKKKIDIEESIDDSYWKEAIGQ